MTDTLRHEERALIERWREKATTADRLAAKFDREGDQAGNAHAFLKERRIWRTCADELEALLRREEEECAALRETIARWVRQGYTDDFETPIDDYAKRVLHEVDRVILLRSRIPAASRSEE